MDETVPVGDCPPDGDRQAVRIGRSKRNESRDLFRCMSRIVLSTQHFVNCSFKVFLARNLTSLFPVVLFHYSPVRDPFGAKCDRIGCVGGIAVDISPPGNFKVFETCLSDFRL